MPLHSSTADNIKNTDFEVKIMGNQ